MTSQMSENQQVKQDNNTGLPKNNSGKPITLHVTFSKILFNKIAKYAKDKGVNEQECIRFAMSTYLDKMGY